MVEEAGFYSYLRNAFPKEFWLGPEIQSLLRWLEAHGQLYAYRHSNAPFLAAIPAPRIEDLTSFLTFQSEPDFMRHWIGSDKANKEVFPILRCGFDGSFMALWRGETDRYVFLGSEGEAFVVAETAVEFILVITMGYESIECADDLLISPKTQWDEGKSTPWPELAALQKWVRETFQVSYPIIGEDLGLGISLPDPFRQYLDQILESMP